MLKFGKEIYDVLNCEYIKGSSRNTMFFNENKSFVDISLNCDIGELKFCVVGKLNENNKYDIDIVQLFQKVFIDLPNNKHGWQPHINSFISNYGYSQTIECKIAKIPNELYGIHDNAIFN